MIAHSAEERHQNEVVKAFSELNRLLPAGSPRKVANNHEKAANQIRMERLLSFIYNYQRTHGGQTPPITVMAHEMETTDQQASRYLNMLNDAGLIHIVDRAPLRVMIMKPFEIVPLVDARRLDNAIKPSMLERSAPQDAGRERFEAVDAKRQRLAHFIGETWKAKGRGPYIKEIMTHLGIKSPGQVWAYIERLKGRGMVTRLEGKQGSLRLTPAGEQVYGFATKPSATTEGPRKEENDNMTKVYDKPFMTPRRVKLLDYIRDYYGKHGHQPSYKEMKEAAGTQHDAIIASALRRFEANGYITRPDRGQFKVVGAEPPVKPVEKAAASDKVIIVSQSKGSTPRGTQLFNMKKLLNEIKDGLDTYGVPPDVADLAKVVGYTNSGARQLIHKMEEVGWVTFKPYNLSTIKLTERGEGVIAKERGGVFPLRPFNDNGNEQSEERSDPESWRAEPAISPLAMPAPEEARVLEAVGKPKVWEPTPAKVAPTLADVDTGDLIIELIERGYVVRRA